MCYDWREVRNMKQSQTKSYNMAQNCGFMIVRAWRLNRRIITGGTALVLCTVGSSLLELFVAPAVLESVGRGVRPGELAGMVGLFALAMAAAGAAKSYLAAAFPAGGGHIRSSLASDVHLAFARTSYPHTEDPAYIKRHEKAQECTHSGWSAGQKIYETMQGLAANLICFAIYLLLLANVGVGMVLLSAALTAAGYFMGNRFRAWRHEHKEEEGAIYHKLGYVAGRSKDITLAKDVRIFGLAPWLRSLYAQYRGELQDYLRRLTAAALREDMLNVLLALLRNGAAYGWLLWLAVHGELSAAEFVLYFTAVSGFTQWVAGLFSGFAELHKQSLEIAAFREFMEEPEIFRFEDGKPLPVKPDHLYQLELRDVSFRYPGADHDTLSHVNLTIRPGEKLAVVGRNGAGKTTLIKLLCGLYDPTEGQVLLDGEDIRQFNRRDYYKHFAAVFQSFSVMAGTVAENVAQTDRNTGKIDLPRVWDCLEKAGVAEKVRSMPKGGDTMLDRSVYLDAQDLSGGQMQKLMLARALYKDAPLVMLDEPTAALDPLAERDMYLKYNDLTGRRTSVYISHRLASTRFCDRVLLLDGGGIAEEGTHESLLALGGQYARLFHIQSKYYQEGAKEDDQ